jgi:hypothetical protein
LVPLTHSQFWLLQWTTLLSFCAGRQKARTKPAREGKSRIEDLEEERRTPAAEAVAGQGHPW